MTIIGRAPVEPPAPAPRCAACGEEPPRLDLVAWCDRCGVEMELNHTRTTAAGLVRDEFICGVCRRTWSVTRNPNEEPK